MPQQRLRARDGVFPVVALWTGLWLATTVGVAAAQNTGPAGNQSATAQATGYQDLVAQGKALLKADKLEEAVAKFNAAIQQAQADGQSTATRSYLYCLLGLVQTQGGSALRADAIASLQKSVELDPESADCRLELAKSQYADKQYSEAKRSADAVAAQTGVDAALLTEAVALAKRAQVMALFADGRRLLKGREADAAAARIKEATDGAEAAGLAKDERSLLHYVRVLALREAGRDREAIDEARVAIALSPKDAELHLELAQALFDTDQFVPARQAAEEALRLGLGESDDQASAKQLVKNAKTEALHERFTFYGSASFGYDSNVLQSGNVQTIAGRCASCGTTQTSRQTNTSTMMSRLDQLRAALMMLTNELVSNYPSAINKVYATPTPSVAEWDLPISVNFDLAGRLFSVGTFETWLGYRFYQYFMTSAGFDHDAYNMQEHTVPFSISWKPTAWLQLRPRIEGFANFTGLKAFAPYQGGMLAVVDAVFIEGARFRTRLLYQHQLRRSFNRTDDTYLDGDRDDARLTQELRLKFGAIRLRGQLSYRFRSDRTGVFEDTSGVPFTAQVPRIDGSIVDVTFGNFLYRAPLGYLSHDVSTRWRLNVPWDLELAIGGDFEYRAYSGDYSAVFVPMRVQFPCPREATACTPGSMVTVPTSAATLELPATQRIDKTITADLMLGKTLPHGFSLDLSYVFLVNFSTIANALDNRNYTKHQVLLSAGYAF